MFKPSRICVYLGGKCNLKCLYCFRRSEDEIIASDIKDLSIKFIDYVKQVSPEWCHCFNFSGGEPLIYFDYIKKIIPLLDPKLRKKVMTNGTLLTNEIVDYFNEHKVEVCISYDGCCSSKTRGIDVLANECQLKIIKKIKLLSFSCVITNLNTDVYENYLFILKRVERPISFYPAPLAPYDGCYELTEKFNFNVFERSIAEFQTKRDYEIAKQMEYKTVKRLGIMIDFNGNLLSLKDLKKVGTVDDNYKIVEKNIIQAYGLEKCKECKLREHCHFPKQLSSNSSHMCMIEQRLYNAGKLAKLKGKGIRLDVW